eukprot:5667083-Lingulodinium_polyedra.AAC.1
MRSCAQQLREALAMQFALAINDNGTATAVDPSWNTEVHMAHRCPVAKICYCAAGAGNAIGPWVDTVAPTRQQ